MKAFKRTIIILLTLALISGLAACGSNQSDAPDSNAGDASGAVTEIKLSTAWGENSSVQQGAEKFKELLEEASDGRYVVMIYPSDQLASGNQISAIEMVQTGATELDLRGFVLYSTLDPRAAVVNMPFIMPTTEDVDKIFFNGEGAKALDGVVEDMGLQPLAWGEAGYRQITNNVREITSPEDMAGLKFRIPSMPMFSDLYGILGTNTTTINMGEVFTSLQQGVVDGQENAVDTALSYKIQEVQKYMTCWNGVYDPLLFSASPAFWSTLSEEDQQMFLDCAAEAMQYQVEQNRQTEQEIWATFEEAGCHVTHLTDEQIAAFQEATRPVYDQWYDQIGEELFAAFGYTK